ncbi:MAG: hypothetical protein P4L40_00525 [Terracidiphilus sp.]|nr:hypothetical protein [Terracidiphilus sp.]
MRCRVLAGAMTAVLLSFVSVQACGPDFTGDVFVYTLHPDSPKDFAAGRLGVLLPTYPRADLAVAYRYLIGGALGRDEQAAYAPTYSMAEPDPADRPWREGDAVPEPPQTEDAAGTWHKARAAYAPDVPTVGQSRELKVKQSDGSIFSPDYLNCHDDAFHTAVLTLQARAKAWGAKSATLRDWIAGQDAVFANCRGGDVVLPVAVPAGSPALLVQDRAYQTAAAEFYAADFEKARAGFEAVAQDKASPWHGLGQYLAARALVRQAFLTPVGDGKEGSNSTALFDAAKMREAETLLATLLKSPPEGLARATIEKELDLVRMRTEPMVRLGELAAAVAGPKTDPEYRQHLTDLTWYLDAKLDQTTLRADATDEMFEALKSNNYAPPSEQQKLKEFDATYKSLDELRSAGPLVDWLITYQSPSAGARAHAIAEWNRTHGLEWLMAAISKATEMDAEAAALVKAAAEVQASSPAWTTLTYHRVRLLAALGRGQEARAVLAEALPQVSKTGTSAVNLFAGLQMRAATTLNEALAQAPRTILERGSEEQAALNECVEVKKNPKRQYDCSGDKGTVALAPDAAQWMNRQAPLETLSEAANATILPERMRQAVAMMTWTRAVLLKDDAVAVKVFPLLPKKLQEQAGPGTGFKSLLTLVRNPGLRPYLDPGVQRSYSFDFVESYGDNWWCSDWRTLYRRDGGEVPVAPVAFLTEEQQKTGAAQAAALTARGDAQLDLGAQVVAYVEAHPSDPDGAEALYLTLRMVRYGCNRGWGNTPEEKAAMGQVAKVRADAARLLRKRYAASPWTKKAAPFVG